MKTAEWVNVFQGLLMFCISAFAFIKAAEYYFKSRVEIQRLRGIDLKAFNDLMQSKEKLEKDIQELKVTDHIVQKDVERIEKDLKETMQKLTNYLFKNFGDH